MDLLIKGGTVVTAQEMVRADVGIEGGKVVEVASHIDATAAKKVVDASGKYVMPGAIDAHTHFKMPFMGAYTTDDFLTGTRSAAAGGVTCIIDFALQSKGGSLKQALETWKGMAEGNAIVDYAFHMAITDCTPSILDEIREMVRQGVTSFKFFMAYKGSLMVDDAALFESLRVTSECGALGAVHAENGFIIDVLQREAVARGDVAPKYHALTRPPEAEGEATRRAISLAKMAGAPLLVVHVSAKEAVKAIEEARMAGQIVYGETCPQYLGVIDAGNYEEPDFGGAKYVCSPPLRTKDHPPVLWDALRFGFLQEVSSDHCSFDFSGQKRLGKDDFRAIPNGCPGVETTLGVLHNEGVNKGRISLNQLVALVSTNSAKIYGLYPQKGTIAVGSDADIVIFDPDKEMVVSQKIMHHAVDYTPFEGHHVKGWPAMTISRGEVIYEDGEVKAAPGRGKFVPRKPINTKLLLA